MSLITRANLVRRLVVGFAAGVAFVAAGGGEIRVAGSDLLGPAFTRAVQDFTTRSGQPVQLDLRGTRPGIETLVAGGADVGLFLLPPGETPPGDPLTTRMVACQVTVVAVSAELPLPQLTLEQLKELFGQKSGGNVLTWSRFGLREPWAGRPVRPLALKSEASLAWPQVRSLLAGAGEDGLLVKFEESHDRLAGSLRADPAGIVVAGLSLTVEPDLRLVALATDANQPAFPPTPENVHAGRYPLRMPLWVAFRRADGPRLLPFLRFLLGPETAQALAPADFMPVPEGEGARLGFEFEEMR